MQTFRSAPVPLLMPLLALLCPWLRPAALRAASPNSSSKTHNVTLGAAHKVPYTPPSAAPQAEPQQLKVRPLLVDGRQREWTLGDTHDVTDRSFTVQRALRINDALPADQTAHWVWQPGPWLLVDRSTGHIAALRLPDFDPIVSEVVWFRDYAAYCGVAQTGKESAKGGLYAVVAQVGVRKPVMQKQIAPWPPSGSQTGPPSGHAEAPCQPAQWQRQPIRVTLQLAGEDPVTFDIVGGSSIVEEGDGEDP